MGKGVGVATRRRLTYKVKWESCVLMGQFVKYMVFGTRFMKYEKHLLMWKLI